MKITCLLGSPRTKGNSATMAHKFCEALKKETDAEIEYIELNKLNYRGCQACGACKKNHDECVLQDDLADVLASVKESAITILASPVYYGDVSAQLKAFIDRTYSYLVPGYKEKIGKEHISRLQPTSKFVMILSQNASKELCNEIYPKYKILFETFLGIKMMPLIRGCGLDKKTDAINNAELMEQVESAARKFITED